MENNNKVSISLLIFASFLFPLLGYSQEVEQKVMALPGRGNPSPILAMTAIEYRDSTSAEAMRVMQERADFYCKQYGFQRASYFDIRKAGDALSRGQIPTEEGFKVVNNLTAPLSWWSIISIPLTLIPIENMHRVFDKITCIGSNSRKETLGPKEQAAVIFGQIVPVPDASIVRQASGAAVSNRPEKLCRKVTDDAVIANEPSNSNSAVGSAR